MHFFGLFFNMGLHCVSKITQRKGKIMKKNVTLDRWVVMMADCLQNYGRGIKEQYVLKVGLNLQGDELVDRCANVKLSELAAKKVYRVYLSLYDSTKNRLNERGFDDSRESFEMLYHLPSVDLLMALPEDQLEATTLCD